MTFNIVLNPGFESYASSTDFNNWNEYKSGTSTIMTETTIIHSGSTSCKISVDASNSLCGISTPAGQNMTVIPNTKYRFSIWLQSSTSGQMEIGLMNNTQGTYLKSDGTWSNVGVITRIQVNTTTNWVQWYIDFTTQNEQTQISIFDLKRTGSGPSQANRIFYVDDISISPSFINLDETVTLTDSMQYSTIILRGAGYLYPGIPKMIIQGEKPVHTLRNP